VLHTVFPHPCGQGFKEAYRGDSDVIAAFRWRWQHESILTLEGVDRGSQTPSRIDQLLPSWKVAQRMTKFVSLRRGRRITARSRNRTIVLRTIYSSLIKSPKSARKYLKTR
jgi:hypothetical protein